MDELDNEPKPPGESERNASPTGWVLLALFVIALVVTRFLDLGRQSPWNDEVNNWFWALRYPEGRFPPHPITYLVQGWFLSIRDTVYFLRLPSALLVSASGLVVFCWLWRTVSTMAAGVFGFLFALSPMAIFYSQDANHYGYLCLAGALGVVGGALFWSERCCPMGRWLAMIAIAIFLGLMKYVNEFAVFALGAFGAVVAIRIIIKPNVIPGLGKIPQRKVQIVIGCIYLLLAILVAFKVHEIATRAEHFKLPGVVYYSLSPLFQGRLFANFFGGYLLEGPLDYLLGVLAAAVSAIGWFLFVKRNTEAWGGILFLMFFMVAISAFLTIYSFYHSFHIRYIIALLPGLLIGVALAASELWNRFWVAREADKQLAGSDRFMGMSAIVVIALFTLRFATWAGGYYAGNFQPAIPAMEYIAANTPSDAIVGTRSSYLASAFSILNERLPADQKREYIWLGESPPSTQNAAGMSAAMASLHPGKFYLLDMAWLGESNHVDFNRYLNEETETIATFSSSVPRDFTGDDRSLVLRRPIEQQLEFPIAGRDAASVSPLDLQVYQPLRELGSTVPPMLAIRSGLCVNYLLPSDANGESVYINVSMNVPDGETEWMLGAIGGNYMTWKLEGRGVRSLELNVPAANGEPNWLILNLAKSQQSDPASFPVTQMDSIDTAPASEEGIIPSIALMRYESDGVGDDGEFVLDYAGEDGTVTESQVQDVRELPLFVISEFDAKGLSNRLATTQMFWTDAAGTVHRVVRLQEGWATHHTVRPTLFGYVFDQEAPAAIDAKFQLVENVIYTPKDKALVYKAPAFYVLDSE